MTYGSADIPGTDQSGVASNVRPVAGRMAPAYRFLLGLFLGGGMFLLTDVVINMIVDPFDRAPFLDLPFNREQVSKPINRRLYQLQQSAKDPKPNMIIGDSRGELLNAAYFRELGTEDWGNASFGGASLFEEYETLQFIQSVRPVKQAIVTLQLREWNDGYDPDQVREAVDLLEHPSHYYLSLAVLDASIANLRNLWTGGSKGADLPSGIAGLSTPEAQRKAFWQFTLKGDGEILENWRAPIAAKRTFLDMIDFAKSNKIDLTILLLPVNDAMRNLILQRRGAEYQAFKQYVKAQAKVLDFDVPSVLTADDTQWRDPEHFTPDVARGIVKSILQEKAEFPVVLSCPKECDEAPDAVGGGIAGQ
ncbi:MAG: hypothetical protein JWO51_5097 [Rhodospirillales bacterium]|nr:hypothetical protein [Rhodospirillales bacterium]